MYRQQYFEVLEIITGELSRRFNQDKLGVIKKLELMLLSAANGEFKGIPETVKDLYKGDFDFGALKRQLPMLQDTVRSAKIKRVTSVKTICDIFNNQMVCKQLFSKVHKVLCLYLTIPVTSATAERTFSILRRLKTYLRGTMAQKRLTK